jgi:hypothetical protein
MEDCPGCFFAATKNEVWKLLELHATLAHGENPSAWNSDTRAQLQALIKFDQGDDMTRRHGKDA